MNLSKTHYTRALIALTYVALSARAEYNSNRNMKHTTAMKKDIQDSLNSKIDSKMELIQCKSNTIIHQKLRAINDKVDQQVKAKLSYYDAIYGCKK
jgi:hypothetical protein